MRCWRAPHDNHEQNLLILALLRGEGGADNGTQVADMLPGRFEAQPLIKIRY
jgi:hypothetical protein